MRDPWAIVCDVEVPDPSTARERKRRGKRSMSRLNTVPADGCE